MFQATEVLSGSVAQPMLQPAALPISFCDSYGDLIVANAAVRSATSIFRDAAGNVLEFDLDIAA